MSGSHATKIDSMLRHLAGGGDAQDFTGTKYENLALARTIERRGLIAWDGEGNRYVLTRAGWSTLTPRRFGLPSLAASAALGAIGVAALAFLVLPGARSQDSARGHAATPVAVHSPAPASVPVEMRGSIAATVPANAPQQAPGARAAGAESTMPPVTPLDLTEVAQPAPEQPNAEAAPTSVKQAAVKKQQRRTARPPEQHNGLSNFFASFGRTREPAQARARQTSQTRSSPSPWSRI
jgi:hypothetical protein